MQNREARNNTLAGLFVVGSAALGVGVAFLLAERGAGMGATRFQVRFAIDQGAAGISEGSPVLLGGQQVGRVLSVGFSGADASADVRARAEAAPRFVDVGVEVRKDVTLFENATVYLERPLLGSLSNINIVSPGSAADVFQGQSARLEAGEVLVAGAAPGLLAQAGLGPAQIDQFKRTLENVDQAVARLAKLVDVSSPDVEATLTEVRTLVSDVRSNFTQWDGRIDTTLANVEGASARVDPLFDKVEQSVQSATSVFEEARAIVSENRTQIEEILMRVESVAEKIDGESVELLNQTLRDARSAMAQANTAVLDVQNLISEQRPNIQRTFANMRLTADQLKLTAIEVRSQPWRLLHEPTTKELESQVLYDATRSYAQAASDVRAASEALSQVALRQPAEGQRVSDAQLGQAIVELGEQLQRSMQRFEQAERRLLETLIEKR